MYIERLLVASTNRKKLDELRDLLRRFPLELTSLQDYPNIPPFQEAGSSFSENARGKAEYYSQGSGLCCLADDSGLEVEALGGKPGIYSARYAGPNASDEENIDKLLSELGECPPEKRTARFVCAAALAGPDMETWIEIGECRGGITIEPAGSFGFGYDPVFIPEGHTRTFGELGEEVKQSISHRAKALALLLQRLEASLDSQRTIA